MDADKREMLKSMLNNLIHDKREEADMDLHNYLTAKMKSVSGISGPETEAAVDVLPDSDDLDDAQVKGSTEVDETD